MSSKRAIISTNPPQGVWPFTAPRVIYEPLAVAIVAIIAFGVAFAMGQQWVCVPLAATIVTAAVTPASEEAAFSHAVLGNLIAILVGYVTIDTIGGLHHHAIDAALAANSPTRILGVVIAIALTPAIATLLRIVQPAAAATAAFIVFGGIDPTAKAALAMTVDVVIVAGLGELMRRLRVRGAPRA